MPENETPETENAGESASRARARRCATRSPPVWRATTRASAAARGGARRGCSRASRRAAMAFRSRRACHSPRRSRARRRRCGGRWTDRGGTPRRARLPPSGGPRAAKPRVRRSATKPRRPGSARRRLRRLGPRDERRTTATATHADTIRHVTKPTRRPRPPRSFASAKRRVRRGTCRASVARTRARGDASRRDSGARERGPRSSSEPRVSGGDPGRRPSAAAFPPDSGFAFLEVPPIVAFLERRRGRALGVDPAWRRV